MAISKIFRFGFELALASLCACAPGGDAPADDAGTFVAFAPDFANYTNWASFNLGDGGAGDDAGCVHVADVPRVAYLNATPAHGATEFPVGTILVKEIHAGAAKSDWQVLAMVKRGGGYNPASGCAGWEWFGLDVTGASPAIQWRGVQPPTSESYASCGACSSCHSAASFNDCVLAPELSLSQW